MKTAPKSLSDLGLVDVTISKYEWDIDSDSDGESVWLTAQGTVAVTVKIAERNTEVAAAFTITNDVFEQTTEADVTACDISEEEDTEAVLKMMAAKVDWNAVGEYLTENYGQEAHDAASDAMSDSMDRAEEARDPYRYRGLSRHDF